MRSAWAYSLFTIIFLLAGAVFLQAATADITDVAFVTAPAEITSGESGYFTVEAQDESGDPATADSNVTVSLSDDGSGTFYEVSGSSCSSTELTNDEVTITSGSSTASFCYENSSIGDYNLTASINAGDAGVPDYDTDATYGAENVWTNSYEAVWHMNQVNALDSTSGGHDVANVVGSPTVIDSQMGNAVEFSGSGEKLETGSAVPFDSTGASSIFARARFDVADKRHYIFKGEGGSNGWADGHFIYRNSNALQMTFIVDTGSTDDGNYYRHSSDNTMSTSSFLHVGYTYPGGQDGNDIDLYIEGVIPALDSANNNNSGTDTTSDFNIIGGHHDDTTASLVGAIDELRVASVERSTDWASAAYANQDSTGSFYSTGSQETGTSSGWYDSDWDYRQQITVQSAQIDSNLSDFPVYVDLSDLGSDFFAGVKDNGGDIRITTTDGTTELAREVVSVDTSGQTGELHFKADSLSSSSDTDFYIYYGNGTSSASTSVSVIAASGVGSGDVLEPGSQESDSDDADKEEETAEEDPEPVNEDAEEETEEPASQETSVYNEVLNDARNTINEITQSFIKSLIKKRTGLEPWIFGESF